MPLDHTQHMPTRAFTSETAPKGVQNCCSPAYTPVCPAYGGCASSSEPKSCRAVLDSKVLDSKIQRNTLTQKPRKSTLADARCSHSLASVFDDGKSKANAKALHSTPLRAKAEAQVCKRQRVYWDAIVTNSTQSPHSDFRPPTLNQVTPPPSPLAAPLSLSYRRAPAPPRMPQERRYAYPAGLPRIAKSAPHNEAQRTILQIGD